jgi:hypothetical protein
MVYLLGKTRSNEALPVLEILSYLDVSSVLSSGLISKDMNEFLHREEQITLWRSLWLWDTSACTSYGRVVRASDSTASSPAKRRHWNGIIDYTSFTTFRNLEVELIQIIQQSLFATRGVTDIVNFMRMHMGLERLMPGSFDYTPFQAAPVGDGDGDGDGDRDRDMDRDSASTTWEASVSGLFGATRLFRVPTFFSLDQKRYSISATKVFVKVLTALKTLLDHELAIYSIDLNPKWGSTNFTFNTDSETAFVPISKEDKLEAIAHLIPTGRPAPPSGAPLIATLILPPPDDDDQQQQPSPSSRAEAAGVTTNRFRESEVLTMRRTIICCLTYVKGVDVARIWDGTLAHYAKRSPFTEFRQEQQEEKGSDDAGEKGDRDTGIAAASASSAAKEATLLCMGDYAASSSPLRACFTKGTSATPAEEDEEEEEDNHCVLLSGLHAIGYSKLAVPYKRAFVDATISTAAALAWKVLFSGGAESPASASSRANTGTNALPERLFFHPLLLEDNAKEGERMGGYFTRVRDAVCAVGNGPNSVLEGTARALTFTFNMPAYKAMATGIASSSYNYSSRNMEAASELRNMLRERAKKEGARKVFRAVVSVLYGPQCWLTPITEQVQAPSFLGITRPVATNAGYYAVSNTFLDNVCHQKTGIPITLGSLLVLVCGEVGINVFHENPAGLVPLRTPQHEIQYYSRIPEPPSGAAADHKEEGVFLLSLPGHVSIGIGTRDYSKCDSLDCPQTVVTDLCDPFRPWVLQEPAEFITSTLHVPSNLVNSLMHNPQSMQPAKHLEMWERSLRNLSHVCSQNIESVYPFAAREGLPIPPARKKGPSSPPLSPLSSSSSSLVVGQSATLSLQNRYICAFMDALSLHFLIDLQREILEEFSMLETQRWNHILLGKANPGPTAAQAEAEDEPVPELTGGSDSGSDDGSGEGVLFPNDPVYDPGKGGTVDEPDRTVLQAYMKERTATGVNGSVFTTYSETAGMIMTTSRCQTAAMLGMPQAVLDAKYQAESNIAGMARARGHGPIGMHESFMPGKVLGYFRQWVVMAKSKEDSIVL